VTKPFSLDQGTSRAPIGLRAGLAGLLIASTFVVSTAARADVFGGAAAAAAQGTQPGSVMDRVAALEAQLKELREKGAPATSTGAAQPTARPNLNVPPPLPGLEGLPAGGADAREQVIVQKELTYEVLGSVNDSVYVRDGDKRMVLSPKEFKAFEKAKREKVVQKLRGDAVGTSGNLTFPELQPPPDATTTQATTGTAPSAPPTPSAAAAGKPTTPTTTPAKPGTAVKSTASKPVTTPPTPGKATPASPVKKN
jgi:hypothetical protein